MKKISLKEQKKILFEMLEKINQICIDNDLKLYLGGGTLLGAVRHKGFIPWDDDIDVMLMREDYEKLLSIFNNSKIKNLKMLSYHNASDYYFPFAKVVNTDTILIEPNTKSIEELGLYIDIFPIDYIYGNNLKIKYVFLKKRIYQSILNFHVFKDVYSISNNKITKIYKTLVKPFFSKLSPTYAAKKIDNLLRKCNDQNSPNVICLSGVYNEKELMSKNYISNSVEVEFEGKKYLAPIGYHDYLVKHYGKNYMQLPPEEKRILRHNNKCYWR